MSTYSIPRPRTERDLAGAGLVEPAELEGTCPCCPAVHLVDEAGALPVHKVPPSIDRPVCAGSGEQALEIHARSYFYVEGVRFL